MGCCASVLKQAFQWLHRWALAVGSFGISCSRPGDPPEDLLCPVTCSLFRDPVFNAAGNTYERSALEKFWTTSGMPARDPITNTSLTDMVLIPNWDMRRRVQSFLEANPRYVPEGWPDQSDWMMPICRNLVIEPDIRAMSVEERRCVKDLTISKPNVGSIHFHGTTDCTNLVFNSIIRMEVGDVSCYLGWPDDLKHPVGVGLNKPATITMSQCWPPTIMDEEHQQSYKLKIKMTTEQMGAKFLDYDSHAGIWKFEVQHF
eukprot:TRINITY_DN19458_c0_g1_i2.p2 TRINITY_DN19458_c0_g1~~TRINITY_DN19458_c0_g1_i2.p2  ORF type:complete len:259 (+),score=41.26 TRINITY_DN19458_c0_g1_i2:98-874(+)